MTPGSRCRPLAVDHLAGRSARQVADGGKAAAAQAQVARAFTVVVDHGAAFEDEIVGIGHFRTFPIEAAGACRDAPSAYVLRQVLARDQGNEVSRAMQAALLPDRGVIKVAGDDARRFLNGLATNDIGKVAPGARALPRC